MTSQFELARIIRVFVSSPSDVKEERKVLDEVMGRINRTTGENRGVRLELWKWEKDCVPQIGPSPQECVDKQLLRYDIYLGIMKHRFGTPTGGYGSGTEKEFHDALTRWGAVGTPWILFYFGKENIDPDMLDLDQYAKVRQFRKTIQSKGLYANYEGVRGSNEAFFEKVGEHLRKIVYTVPPLSSGFFPEPEPSPADATKYLRALLSRTSFIDIRGLQVGQERAHRFPIEDLFITLTGTHITSRVEEEREKNERKRAAKAAGKEHALGEGRALPLHAALKNDRLVVLGDPGAGKTTFVRRVAHALCETELGEAPDAAGDRLGLADRTFPILVRLTELDDHITRYRKEPGSPGGETSPAWLPHFLAASALDNDWGLDSDFFRGRLEGGFCTVMFDGLDEAADRISRKRLSRLIDTIAGAYGKCRFVVTTRPAGYTDETHLADFAHTAIGPLADEAVETFLSRWCEALYVENSESAQSHCAELSAALRERPEIRRMARNPVMLTALAVVHWNERRLPEQRADLYESIIHWLSRAREQKLGREDADHTVVLLQELALAMQNHPDGMRTAVARRWAAEQLAGEWASGEVDRHAIAKAETFLDAEELDSGIVVGRGDNLQFWHRTFQEFLAARAIAAHPDAVQEGLLWGPPPRLYLPEWREIMLLLAGILHRHGRAKVDNLIRSMLDNIDETGSLTEQARCMGLVGALLQDLRPVKYKVTDARLEALRRRVQAIFDHKQSKKVLIEDRIAAADALGQAGDPRLDMRREDYWASIDAGEFWMGAQSSEQDGRNYDSDADEDESPVRKVYLDAYRIARYPVTVGEYRRFVESKGYEDRQWWGAGGFGEFSEPQNWEDQLQFPSRPVVSVSWYEASAYCRWVGCRLLTEAEWERAARGTEGRQYPWEKEGVDPSRLNYSESGLNHPTPVGIYPIGTTPEGICDLAGNVDEWCADGHGPFNVADAVSHTGPKETSDRVVRGGSWYDVAKYCRASAHDWFPPSVRDGGLGFRIAPVQPGQRVEPV